MTDKDKTTLREFINKLEKLSDGGKNDNLEVGIQNSDEEFEDLKKHFSLHRLLSKPLI